MNRIFAMAMAMFFAFVVFSKSVSSQDAVPNLDAVEVSNVFFETSVNDVAKDLSFQTGINIFATDAVTGLVTATFQEVSLRQALDIVISGTTLNYKLGTSSVIIYEAKGQGFEALGTKNVKVLEMSSVSGLELKSLIPESYSAYVQSVKGGPAKNTIIVVAADPVFTEVVKVVSEIDNNLSSKSTIFKPENIPAEPLYNLLGDDISNFVTVSENLDVLFIQAGPIKTNQIIELLTEIDDRASFVSDQLISSYVVSEHAPKSVDVEIYIKSIPKFFKDYVSFVKETNKLVYFGPEDLLAAFTKLTDVLDEDNSTDQFAVLPVSSIDAETFLSSLPMRLRAKTFVDEKNGKIIVAGTEAEVSKVLDLAQNIAPLDSNISYVFSAKNFAAGDFSKNLPKELSNFVSSLNDINKIVFFGPASLLPEVKKIVALLDEASDLGLSSAFKVDSVDLDTVKSLIPKNLEQFVTIDELTRTIVVNGSDYAMAWAEDLSTRLNSVAEPVTETFRMENIELGDVGDLFPEYLEPYVFYDKDSQILVAHGPKNEVIKISDIITSLKKLEKPNSSATYILPKISAKAFENLIPSGLKNNITVDEDAGIIVVRNSTGAEGWVGSIVQKLSDIDYPITEGFTLKQYSSADFLKLLPKYLQDNVFYDEMGGRVIVQGSAEKVKAVRDLVNMLNNQRLEKVVSKVFKFDEFSVTNFGKMIPPRFKDYVFFDDKSRKVLVAGPQIIVDEVEDIFLALNKPANYDVELFNYVNFDVKGLEKMIPKEFSDYVSFDTDTNSILVNGPPEVVEYIRQAVEATAPFKDQIILEAKIVAFDREDSIDFGPEFNWPDIRAGVATGLKEGVISRPWEVQFGYAADSSFTNALNVSLELLAQNSEATIFANPTIVTENGSDAEIRVTTAEYVRVEFSDNGERNVKLEEIETGTILKITPTVDTDGNITLDLEVSVSDVVARGAENLPVVISRNATNRVKIKNGGTAAIAGLVDSRTTGRNAGIPGLRNDPLFGTFGSRTSGGSNLKQVAIFVTARTVSAENSTIQSKSNLNFLKLSSDKEFRMELANELK